MRAIQAATLSWQSAAASSRWPGAQTLRRYGQALIPGGLSGFGAIPDNITTVDQAIAAGYGQDEIVAKFGYAAYANSVSAATTGAEQGTLDRGPRQTVSSSQTESLYVNIAQSGLNVPPPPSSSAPVTNQIQAEQQAEALRAAQTNSGLLNVMGGGAIRSGTVTPSSSLVQQLTSSQRAQVDAHQTLDTTGLPNGSPPGQMTTTGGYAQVADTGIPTWAWILGGLALAGGAAYLFFGRGKK